MKMYHICEYCDEIFNTTEIEGTENIEGVVALKGTCEECSKELELDNSDNDIRNHIWYN